jgi:Zn finger protein HypA/HybF involved in hydrogenase expression
MTWKKEFTCLNCQQRKTSLNSYGKYCSNKCQKEFEMYQKVSQGIASHRTLKRYFMTKHGKCSECGIADWKNAPIVLELDHIDGNHKNNDLENLRLLCPNCHSQTPTYRAKNKGNGREYRRNCPQTQDGVGSVL